MISLLLLAGCSTTTSEKHLTERGEWGQLGFTEGQQGLAERSKELKTLHHLNQASLDDYSSSYQQGLSAFCDPEKGYYHGVTGRVYEGQCDHFPHSAELVANWYEGLDQFEYEQFQKMIEENEKDLYYQSLIEGSDS